MVLHYTDIYLKFATTNYYFKMDSDNTYNKNLIIHTDYGDVSVKCNYKHIPEPGSGKLTRHVSFSIEDKYEIVMFAGGTMPDKEYIHNLRELAKTCTEFADWIENNDNCELPEDSDEIDEELDGIIVTGF